MNTVIEHLIQSGPGDVAILNFSDHSIAILNDGGTFRFADIYGFFPMIYDEEDTPEVIWNELIKKLFESDSASILWVK